MPEDWFSFFQIVETSSSKVLVFLYIKFQADQCTH